MRSAQAERTLRERFFLAEVLRRPLARPPGDFRYEPGGEGDFRYEPRVESDFR